MMQLGMHSNKNIYDYSHKHEKNFCLNLETLDFRNTSDLPVAEPLNLHVGLISNERQATFSLETTMSTY